MKYLEYGLSQFRAGKGVDMVDARGVPTVYWLRIGLGISKRDVAAISGLSWDEIDLLEDGRHARPVQDRQAVWVQCADWAARTLNAGAARESRGSRPKTSNSDVLADKRGLTFDQMQRLAYRRKLSPQEAEAEALRRLGVSGS